MLVDGGLRPVREAEVLAVRRRAAQAIQAVFRELDLPPITECGGEAAVIARSSSDMPERDVVADLEGAAAYLERGITGIDIIRALARRGFRDIAEKILAVQKLRISGDYLQTSAVLLPGPRVLSAVNDANDYQGPGTGYRLDPQRAAEICDIPQALDPRLVGRMDEGPDRLELEDTGPASAGTDAGEIVIAVGPAFGCALHATLLGLPHSGFWPPSSRAFAGKECVPGS
jgi:propanediol dehydratase large subunit